MAMGTTAEDGHFAVIKENHLARMGQHGRDIRGDKIFSVPLADDQRRAGLRGNELIGMRLADHCNGKSATQLVERLPDGSFKFLLSQ